MAKRTFATLQAGRGLAAMSVVLYHAATYAGGDPRFWQRRPYYFHFEWGELGVEYFFVLSGIVILLAHWNDQGVPSAATGYLWKRFRRVYPIYWVVLALVLPPLLLNTHLGHNFARDPWVLLSSVLLVHIRSHDTTLSVAWTLFHEVLFYGVFTLVILRRRLGYTLFGLWMLGSVVELFRGDPVSWIAGYFSPLHLLFGLGMLVTWVVKTRPVVNWLAPILAGSAVLLWISIWSISQEKLAVRFWLPAGIAFSLITLGLMELERRERLHVWKPLSFIGAASYSIYLVHFPFMSVAYRLSFSLDRHLHAPLWIWIFLNVAVATAFGTLVYLFVERPLLRWLGRTSELAPQASAALGR